MKNDNLVSKIAYGIILAWLCIEAIKILVPTVMVFFTDQSGSVGDYADEVERLNREMKKSSESPSPSLSIEPEVIPSYEPPVSSEPSPQRSNPFAPLVESTPTPYENPFAPLVVPEEPPTEY